ncbi:7-cyano-7-deazaguanine synthase [bioreactor metagenome]|uniref:7-cyano-7-deazaguanine synthase n=1 Tax=bioreactor metagenome TaxID=1076179 RepID=A0A645BXD9_9ZZZZ
MKAKAVVLLSGGLDSATCLAAALKAGFEVYALSFDYQQRHHSELAAARRVAAAAGVAGHQVMEVNLRQWGGSALTADGIAVPENREDSGIPVTYVPARNLIFLALATGYAEALGARDIFIGVNSVDYSGYPDCRPAFIGAFAEAARLGTRAADEEWKFVIHTPLQYWSKSEIIRHGVALGVDYSLTVSCYQADAEGRACGVCDSCRLRRAGFAEAGVPDPTHYR